MKKITIALKEDDKTKLCQSLYIARGSNFDIQDVKQQLLNICNNLLNTFVEIEIHKMILEGPTNGVQ